MQSKRTIFSFATRRQARQALAARDGFVTRLSPFDRSARMKTARAVAEDEFQAFLAAQALSWPADEVEKVQRALAAVAPRLAGLAASLPATVLVVKTTGEEESDCAYTRRNAIFLPPHKIAYAPANLERLLVHELFHILSRHNRDLREALYQVIGFQPCGEVMLPETLRERKITNPDAPRADHYVAVEYGDAPLAVVPVTYAKEAPYDARRGWGFFDYMELRLLGVHAGATGWAPLRRRGAPLLVQVDEVEGLYERVGRNAGNMTSPEEILAENFASLVMGDRDLPSPRILEDMERVLARWRAGSAP